MPSSPLRAREVAAWRSAASMLAGVAPARRVAADVVAALVRDAGWAGVWSREHADALSFADQSDPAFAGFTHTLGLLIAAGLVDLEGGVAEPPGFSRAVAEFSRTVEEASGLGRSTSVQTPKALWAWVAAGSPPAVPEAASVVARCHPDVAAVLLWRHPQVFELADLVCGTVLRLRASDGEALSSRVLLYPDRLRAGGLSADPHLGLWDVAQILLADLCAGPEVFRAASELRESWAGTIGELADAAELFG